METTAHQRVFRRLAAFAVALSCGLLDPASLPAFPEDLVVEVVDSAGELSREDHRRVLGVLASDARESVRERVAEAAPVLWHREPEAAVALLQRLADDAAEPVRIAAARGLAALIARASPADRVELVCEWVLSPQATRRTAIAAALREPTPLLVGDLALAELAEDPLPEVRALAAQAAARRFEQAPDAYESLLGRLAANDPSRKVRRAARRALGQTAGRGVASA